MDLTPYVTAIREDLNTAASAGDEQTQRAAATLSAALEPATRLAVMNALSDLAAEVTAGLDDQIVEVRLHGREVRVVITDTGRTADDESRSDSTGSADSGPTEPGGDSGPSTAEHDDAGGDISRMTLRLMEQLKGQAEQAAASQGVSLNTFVSQAVQGALRGASQRHTGHGHHHGHGGSSRMHGWVWG